MRSTSARLTFLFASLSAILIAVLGGSLYAWVERGLAATAEHEIATRFTQFRERFAAEYPGEGDEFGQQMRSFLAASGAAAEIRRADGSILFVSDGYAESLPSKRGRIAATSGESFAAGLALRDLAHG